MKKCDYFKDLILTDYIDGELDKNSVGSLESHLLDCHDCRAFLKEVKNNAAMPFQQALHQLPPAELWDSINQSIEQERINRDVSQLFLWIPAFAGMTVKGAGMTVKGAGMTVKGAGMTVRNLIGRRPYLFIPRLVPVFASLILMLLAGSVALNTIQIQRSKEKDQGEYLVSLLSSTGSSAPSDNNNGATPIEQYFL
jgi:hypothetical protein